MSSTQTYKLYLTYLLKENSKLIKFHFNLGHMPGFVFPFLVGGQLINL